MGGIGSSAPANPFGEVKVFQEPNQLLWDDFGSGTIDIINRWAVSTGNGGTLPTQVIGTATVQSSTTTTAFAIMQTIPTFLPRNPGFVIEQAQIQLEFPVLTNAYRFWGFASYPGTPTIAAPLTNAVGWEVGIDGKLKAVTYASGTKNANIDLSSSGANKQPADNATHMYVIYFRGDRICWCLDSYDNVVANTLTGASGPDINTLGWGALAIANNPAPSSSAQINMAQVTISESAHNAFQLADGIYPFRRTTITPQGQLLVGPFTPGTPTTAAAQGTTAAVVATLAAVANKTTYITGFSTTVNNPTVGTNSTVTVSGTVGGSLVYGLNTLAFAATALQPVPLIVTFPSPIPASAVNTAISVTLSALGTGGVGQVNAYGFQL